MLLQLKEVQKAIGAEEILTSVSFMLKEKEKAALVGVNGAGKTSVFRLITGEWQADEGEVACAKNTRIGYLQQLNDDEKICENPNASLYEVLEQVFLPLKEMEAELRALEKAMAQNPEDSYKRYDNLMVKFKNEGGYEQDSRLKGVLRGLGFSEQEWQRPFREFSGGERTRALLAKLLLERSDLLLLDEPTNHLDIESIAWLEDFIRSFRGAVLLISHDRYFLDKTATKTIEIENKKATVYNGNYSYFVEKKAADRALAEKAFTEQQKVLKHHEEVIKTIRSFRTEAAIIRAKSREKMLAQIERVDAPARDLAKMRLRLTPKIKSGNDVLFAENLKMGFGDKPLFSDISLELKRGDKTAIIGVNGIGKTTLIKILAGAITPLGGQIREGVNLRVGFYEQSHVFSAESEAKTIFQEIADTYPRLSQTEIRTTLAAFMFVGDDVFKPISALSGGERGRVQMSKIMLAGANFLILDEPTNHLDLVSKEILEDALRKFEGTVLFISHDRYFINNIATKILELTAQGITEFVGNYDYYLEKKQTVTASPVLVVEKGSSKDEYLRKKEQESLARRKRNRIERLEADIAVMEAKIAECEKKLEDDEINRNAQAVQAVFAQKTELEQEIALMYAEWEELHES
ncbi:MAG: ABC-F family ATP-binding cassette domain-containing protein [Defluviitaleaceae bacterium]|nr:ABC-F family ATP-binding cassette domain-containing protein [Defluviitaleaceae bacterium]